MLQSSCAVMHWQSKPEVFGDQIILGHPIGIKVEHRYHKRARGLVKTCPLRSSTPISSLIKAAKLLVHGPIVILVPTRGTKVDCCELIAHKVEIENLYDNLSVGVAFRGFFWCKSTGNDLWDTNQPTKCALNMFYIFCSLIYYETWEVFLLRFLSPKY